MKHIFVPFIFILIFLSRHASGSPKETSRLLQLFSDEYLRTVESVKHEFPDIQNPNFHEGNFIEGALLLNSQTSRNLGFCLAQFRSANSLEPDPLVAAALARVAIRHGKRVSFVRKDLKENIKQLDYFTLQKLSPEFQYLLLEKAYQTNLKLEVAFQNFNILAMRDIWFSKLDGKRQAEVFYFMPDPSALSFPDLQKVISSDPDFRNLNANAQADVYITYLSFSGAGTLSALAGVAADYAVWKKEIASHFEHPEFLNRDSYNNLFHIAYQMEMTENDFTKFISAYSAVLENTSLSGAAALEVLKASLLFRKNPTFLLKKVIAQTSSLAGLNMFREAILENVLIKIPFRPEEIEGQITFSNIQKIADSIVDGISNAINMAYIQLDERDRNITSEAVVEMALGKNEVSIQFSNDQPRFEETLHRELLKLQTQQLVAPSRHLESLGYQNLSLDLQFYETNTSLNKEMIGTIREFTTGELTRIRLENPRPRRPGR